MQGMVMKKRVLRSFPPVARPDARILILGSMPGEESLRQRQYYAHPKNAFWAIMGRLFGAGRDLPYRRRLARLAAAKVALWDVAGECVRPGSLDSDIEHRSVVPNDFQMLFKRCPHIHAVFFNGKKSAELFHKLVRPNLKGSDRLAFFVLPSTSPAMASLSLGEKTRRWKAVSRAIDGEDGKGFTTEDAEEKEG